jgi:hypothetical protein
MDYAFGEKAESENKTVFLYLQLKTPVFLITIICKIVFLLIRLQTTNAPRLIHQSSEAQK